MRAWFVSDIHIKTADERNSQTLLRFLRSLQSGERPATHLFLLGDIFDLWIGDSKYFHERFRDIVDTLIQIRKNGVEIVYFEGNHDVHVEKFWQKFDIPVWVHEKYFQLGPWRVRVEHGDFINREDKAYARLRRFVRLPLMEKIGYLLPGKVLGELGDFASRQSRKRSSVHRESKENELRQMIRSYAEFANKTEKFDYIITGHMHIRDEFRTSSGGMSINLGSWFEPEPMALLLTEQGHSWVKI